MWPKLCQRLGGITGAFTGLIIGALRIAPCCAAPPNPMLPAGHVILDGLAVALIVVLIAVAFAILVTHRPVSQMLPVGAAVSRADRGVG